jgi:hypothetical protein
LVNNVARKRLLFGIGLVCNFILPWLVYRLTEPHVGESHAIMISAGVPLVWSLIEFARNRKIDVISILVLSGIALSLLAIAFGGSPRLLLFRESLVTGAIGLVLLGSAIIRRPLMRVLVTASSRAFSDPNSDMAAILPSSAFAGAREEMEEYAQKPWFLRLMSVMTVIVGLLLIIETAVRAALIFSLPTERVILLIPVIKYSAVGVPMLITFGYIMPAFKKGKEEDEKPVILSAANAVSAGEGPLPKNDQQTNPS